MIDFAGAFSVSSLPRGSFNRRCSDPSRGAVSRRYLAAHVARAVFQPPDRRHACRGFWLPTQFGSRLSSCTSPRRFPPRSEHERSPWSPHRFGSRGIDPPSRISRSHSATGRRARTMAPSLGIAATRGSARRSSVRSTPRWSPNSSILYPLAKHGRTARSPGSSGWRSACTQAGCCLAAGVRAASRTRTGWPSWSPNRTHSFPSLARSPRRVRRSGVSRVASCCGVRRLTPPAQTVKPYVSDIARFEQLRRRTGDSSASPRSTSATPAVARRIQLATDLQIIAARIDSVEMRGYASTRDAMRRGEAGRTSAG